MPAPRLSTSSACVLLIDVQERLIGEMVEADRLVARCRYLAQMAGVLGLPLAVTEQYVKGLGRTVEPIRSALPPGTPVIEKTRFSACVEPVAAWLEAHGRPDVLIGGIEAHVCILQTGLDLLDGGKNVFAVLDAISGGEPEQIGPALSRLAAAGASITGCVSATYEMIRDASDPAFRGCLPLVKGLRNAEMGKKSP